MSFHPNTFMIGAQKSGTTFLAALLDQSPDVCVSDPKEPQFLSSHFDKGMDYYASCFANHAAKIRLDASTTYSFLRPRDQMDLARAPGLTAPVPQRIHDLCPDARLIYVLRDPVARAVSAQKHLLRNSTVSGSLSLVECMEKDPMLRLVSVYSAQIERYLEVFAPDAFLFLDFKELTSDPASAVAKTCAFLDLDPSQIDIDSGRDSDRHGAYQLTRTGRMIQKVKQTLPGPANMLRKILPSSIKETVIAPNTRKPADIRFHDLEAAADLFTAERDAVRRLTGISL